jgi:hypothetical protein
MIISAAAPAQPWWAIPVVSGVFGFGGALAGAAIAFVSVRSATSRQMQREERDSRRAVYARFIELGMALLRRCLDLTNFHAELAAIQLDTRQSLVPGADQVLLDLKRKAEDLSSRVEHLSREITARREEMLFCYYEVTLYAPRAVRGQAGSTLDALEDLVGVCADGARADGERSIARAEAHRAISDFTGIARADVRSPGALSLGPATRRLKKMQKKDATEADAGEELTASAEEALGDNSE